MTQSKKIGWVSVLFVLIFSLQPGLAAASDSPTLPFPGNGCVGICLHTETPVELMQMIFAITGQSAITHCWVTATVNGVQGAVQSDGRIREDGLNGVHFLSWPDMLDLCAQGSIRLFKPNKKAIGYAELEGCGINLYGIPSFFKNLLAYQLGNLMINIWIQEVLAYRGAPYDWYFLPSDDELYCSELLAHGWNNTGSSFELFPSQKAGTLDGWSSVEPLLELFGYTITQETDVYNVTYILDDAIRPYFEEISVD